MPKKKLHFGVFGVAKKELLSSIVPEFPRKIHTKMDIFVPLLDKLDT
jgi:hypothetical protein